MDDQFLANKKVSGPPSLNNHKPQVQEESVVEEVTIINKTKLVKDEEASSVQELPIEEKSPRMVTQVQEPSEESDPKTLVDEDQDEDEGPTEFRSFFSRIFGSITLYVIILVVLLGVLAFKEYHKIKG